MRAWIEKADWIAVDANRHLLRPSQEAAELLAARRGLERLASS